MFSIFYLREGKKTCRTFKLCEQQGSKTMNDNFSIFFRFEFLKQIFMMTFISEGILFFFNSTKHKSNDFIGFCHVARTQSSAVPFFYLLRSSMDIEKNGREQNSIQITHTHTLKRTKLHNTESK